MKAISPGKSNRLMAKGDQQQRFLSFKEHHWLFAIDLKKFCHKQYSKARTQIVKPVPEQVFKYLLIFQGHRYYAYTYIIISL